MHQLDNLNLIYEVYFGMYRLTALLLMSAVLSCGNAQEHTSSGCSIPQFAGDKNTECGTLMVPENRNDPNSRKIELTYVILKATSNRPKADPIVYLMGGPGGSATSTYPFWRNHSLRRDRDFILIDQRGTGYSSAVCIDLGRKLLIDVISKDINPEDEPDALWEASRACKAEMSEKGVDQGGYNTIQNVLDLEDLRKHLGYGKWNLFGGSYGARLSLAYMRDFPEKVRSSIMAGMFPPHVNIFEKFISHFKQSLFKVFEACAADKDCYKKYPNLKDRYFAQLADLEENPISFTYNGSPFIVNPQDMLLLTHQLLYARQTIGLIPSFLKALEDREDNGAFGNAVNNLAGMAQIVNFAMHWSFNAFDEYGFAGQEARNADFERNPEMKPGPAVLSSDSKVLEDWHKQRAPAFVNEPVRSSIPSLVVNGGFDPVTPPEYAKETVKYLSNAYYAEFPMDGHSTFNPCFFGMMAEFLDNPNKEPSLGCAAKRQDFNWR